jgi:hypothetical protein
MKTTSKDGKREYQFFAKDLAVLANANVILDDMSRYPERFPDAAEAKARLEKCRAHIDAAPVEVKAK